MVLHPENVKTSRQASSKVMDALGSFMVRKTSCHVRKEQGWRQDFQYSQARVAPRFSTTIIQKATR